MKAGIITLYGMNNYGNRLQNYAVFSTLLKLGVDSETLIPKQWTPTPYRLRTEKAAREVFARDEAQAEQNYPFLVRQFRYEAFNGSFIPERHLNTVHFDRSITKEYDFFITGSDQVWNPHFRDSLGQLENRLLQFARSEQRVCFSPSIGMDDLSKKWHDLYRRELSKYPYLNIREQSGAAIIRELTGRNAEVVLDPTFMVDKEEWLSLAKPMVGFDYDSPYILYYFLGKEEDEISAEMREFLDQQIQERGLKEYRLLDPTNRMLHSAGPSEFVHLFSRASLVCTDSFHGTAFSILLGRPFLLCHRHLVIADQQIDMSNRTISLLEKLQLLEKLPENQVLTDAEIWKCDYINANDIIRWEQQKMQTLLKKAMRLG